jgi:hypothetical protein
MKKKQRTEMLFEMGELAHCLIGESYRNSGLVQQESTHQPSAVTHVTDSFLLSLVNEN